MGRRKKPIPVIKTSNVSGDMVARVIEMRKWKKIDYSNPSALEARINEFFDYCVTMNLKPTVELLICSLGISRSIMTGWERRGGWQGEMIGQAKAVINAVLAEMAMDNKINPTTLIWFQKNHEGYQDNPIPDPRAGTGLDRLPSREDILKRLPKEDDDKIEDAVFREIREDKAKDIIENDIEDNIDVEMEDEDDGEEG